MKTKRGKKKKGKLKGPAPSRPALETDEAVVNLISLRSREVDNDNDIGNSNDDDDNMNEEIRSPIEINTPSPTGTEQPVHLASFNPDESIDKKATTGKSVGRVKVKLKASSSSKSRSDTDKYSTAQLGLERKGTMVTDKMVDGEAGAVCSGNVSKKPESIKIKSSLKVVSGGLSGEKSGRLVTVGQDESLQRKEVRKSQQKYQYDKQELDAALTVIKKVMKMEAAEPFNFPVNPEALGIPDYFDVIDTPMDFGTICTNLEKGDKYLNSEDVYKDVQCIWDNCYKYNNKGDYVLDLMKRVKKNFMKYWTGAGLFTEQLRAANDAEGSHGEVVVASNQEHPKSGKSKKTKKRHGRRHKSDCLCAICVLKRRRKEREDNERRVQGQIGFVDNRLTLEFKNEAPTPVESTGGEESSSNMGESLDPDTDGEVEERKLDTKSVEKQEEDEGEEEEEEEAEEEDEEEAEEEDGEEAEEEEEEGNEMEIQKQETRETPEQSQVSDRAREGPNQQSQHGKSQDSNVVDQIHTEKEHMLVEPEEETITVLQNKRKLQELRERQQKAKMFKKFHIENPLLHSLCGTLFPDNHKSVWSGPHSLAHHHQGPGPAARRSCSIQAAIETLMNWFWRRVQMLLPGAKLVEHSSWTSAEWRVVMYEYAEPTTMRWLKLCCAWNFSWSNNPCLIELVSMSLTRAKTTLLGTITFKHKPETGRFWTRLNADDMRLVMSAYTYLKNRAFLPNFGKFTTIVLEGPRDVTPMVLQSSTGLEASKFSPKKWGQSGNSSIVLAAFLGGASLLLSQGIDIRLSLAAILGLAFLDSIFLGGSCLALISSYWPPYKRRILVHEAGHLLVAYLMGCPIRGVILDPIVAMQMGTQGQAGTQFWDEKMDKELAEGRLSGTAFDRYCMVLFAGIAAEALIYGEAKGGENDDNLFRRWSVLQSYNLLKWRRQAHSAAVKALERGATLSVVIRRIEEAMS